MAIERLRSIVSLAVPTLFRQIAGGRVKCEREATLQLHLGRIIATVADLEICRERETSSIELERPLVSATKRGRTDIWYRLTDEDARDWRRAIEIKFFKQANQREPNNRYDVLNDIHRLELGGDISDLGFMLIATDHPHDILQDVYSQDTSDFDFSTAGDTPAGPPSPTVPANSVIRSPFVTIMNSPGRKASTICVISGWKSDRSFSFHRDRRIASIW